MEQTNRTLLFEEIDPEQTNLIHFMLDDRVESLSDEELLQINKRLEIRSFSEVFQKFDPMMHLLLDSEQKQVFCTNSSSECHMQSKKELISVRINEAYPLLHLFTDMLAEGKKKGTCGSPDDILPAMFPVPQQKEFIKDRNIAVRHLISGRKKKADQALEKMLKKYDNSIFLIQTFLAQAEDVFRNKVKEEGEAIVVIDEKEETQVKVLRCSEHFYLGIQKLDELQKDCVLEWMDQKIEGVSLVNKELWKALFHMPYQDHDTDSGNLAQLYREYLEYYVKIIYTYWSSLSTLMESLLGIYVFFQQYQTKEEVIPPRLIVANIGPEMFTDIRNSKKLHMYLNSTNQKNFYEDTVWYGIIPRLEWNDVNEKGKVRERFGGNTHQVKRQKNSVWSVKNLADLLTEYRIQVFISPNISEKATNRSIALNGAEEWIHLVREVADREHASYIYPCIPNFTLMPSEHAAFHAAREIFVSEWGEAALTDQFAKVWLKTIGIEASYAAAGLFAACQCPGYLNGKFKGKVNMEFPGVAYQIRKDQKNEKTIAAVRMDVMRCDAAVREELATKTPGIVMLPHKNGAKVVSDWSAAYLYGRKDCFSHMQTMTYMERKIRFETQDFKSTLIKNFFQNRPGSLRAKWSSDTAMVNSILKDGENVEYILDEKNNECIFEIRFQEEKREHVVKLNK